MQSISHVHIGYGSESGNAEQLAQQLAQQTFLQPYQPTLATLNDTDLSSLDPHSLLLIVTSSFGDGEPPENAEDFIENYLANPTAYQGRYAIFGLGDASYDKFCGYSQKLDQLLQSQQVSALIERVDADLNYQEIFKKWLPLVERAITQPETTPVAHDLSVKVYDEKRTYQAKVLEIQPLAHAEPAVYHIRLSLKNSGIFYQAGDLIYVQVQQPAHLLDTFVQWFGDKSATEQLRYKELRILSKNVLRDLAKICANTALKDLLKIANKKALEQYLYGHDLLDVLRDFDPEKTISLADLQNILGNLTARAYSISSCGKTHPEYVDLCVRQVQYQLAERHYYGTASCQLAQLQAGDFVQIFAKSNPHFHLPTNAKPIVMIGSGTGIAPYIGFLQNLATQSSPNSSYLFFGERYMAKDFLYQAELEQHLQNGTLTRLFTAFSRDQAEKFYVQDVLAQQAALVWLLIEQGAYFYVCGSKAMSKAIDETLIQIAEQEGNQSYVDAFNNIVAQLVAEKRLLRDVY
ncbi:diflavin oxidoreductase [Actinobacillus vicugnae]|uniref:diflavin oxidoreductase n=1 Tax=Actinobacillus vicugnae TaxID=2573093 RepID=UPI001241E930|nr:sulfite reductase flavoprotein subunit alpha [Actinobacillus vicugnae]